MVMFGNALAQRRAALVPGDPSMTPGAMQQMAGFRGAQPSPAAAFAPPPSYGTPPIAGPAEDWIPNPSAMDTGGGAGLPDLSEPVAKPGFFDRDGMGLNLLGGLSDGVLALNGMAPVYAPAQQHRQERRDKLQDASTARQQQIQTWIAQQQYMQQHPDPVAPHYFETNNGSQGMIGADGKPQILYQDPDSKMNFIPDGMGGGNWVPVPSMGAGGAPAPTAGMPSPVPTTPVGKITPISGGAPSQGARTFPVR